MAKKRIVIHGIILAPSYEHAVKQFNTFCKGTYESRYNKDNIWFTKCCKSSPVPGNFKSPCPKPFSLLPKEDFDEAQFVISNFKLYDINAKKLAKNAYPSQLAWKVAATREI